MRHERWDQLRQVVTDEVLGEIVPTARYDTLAETIRGRLAPLRGDASIGVTLAMPENPEHDAAMAGIVAQLQQGPLR